MVFRQCDSFHVFAKAALDIMEVDQGVFEVLEPDALKVAQSAFNVFELGQDTMDKLELDQGTFKVYELPHYSIHGFIPSIKLACPHFLFST